MREEWGGEDFQKGGVLSRMRGIEGEEEEEEKEEKRTPEGKCRRPNPRGAARGRRTDFLWLRHVVAVFPRCDTVPEGGQLSRAKRFILAPSSRGVSPWPPSPFLWAWSKAGGILGKHGAEEAAHLRAHRKQRRERERQGEKGRTGVRDPSPFWPEPQ